MIPDSSCQFGNGFRQLLVQNAFPIGRQNGDERRRERECKDRSHNWIFRRVAQTEAPLECQSIGRASVQVKRSGRRETRGDHTGLSRAILMALKRIAHARAIPRKTDRRSPW